MIEHPVPAFHIGASRPYPRSLLGVLAGARISPEKLREDIRAVKARTDSPFGVNFILARPEEGSKDVDTVQRFGKSEASRASSTRRLRATYAAYHRGGENLHGSQAL
jgi:NAD(P)H-dependent flavin oxidoreductase YrpB (nitropropane dioxygenase family)